MSRILKLLSLLLPLLTLLLTGCHRRYDPSLLVGPGPTGFMIKTLTRGDRIRQYTVFIPHSFTPQAVNLYPVILYLHDIGEGGDNPIAPLYVGLAPFINKTSSTFPYIVIFSLSNNGQWHPGSENAKDAIAELDIVSQQYPVDVSRISLIGIGTGGYGAWAIGSQHHERFAALVPMASTENDPHLTSYLAHIPIRAYHNQGDPFAALRNDELMVETVNRFGGDARLHKTDGPGHDCWEIAFGESDLLPWLQKQRRPATQPR